MNDLIRCAIFLATVVSVLSPSYGAHCALEGQVIPTDDSSSTMRFFLTDGKVLIGSIVSEHDGFIRIKTDSAIVDLSASSIRSREPYVESAPKAIPQVGTERTQSPPRTLDVITMKGGSVIKGRIEKYEPLIVQLADSSVITLNMNDVLSISKELPSSSDSRSRPPSARRPAIASDDVADRATSTVGGSFLLFAGFGLPVGDFGESSPNVAKAGFAKSGFATGMEGSTSGEIFRTSYGITLSFNGSDFGSVLLGLGSIPSTVSVNVESGSWTNIWIMLGGGLQGRPSSSFAIRGEGLLGALVGLSPEITVTARDRTTGQTASASIDKATAGRTGLWFWVRNHDFTF